MRKGSIELYRFLMALIICLHHFRLYSDALPYGGGYLAVDFFFILSGFFLYKHSKQKSRKDKPSVFLCSFDYIVKRYNKLYPQYLFILIFSAFFYIKFFKIVLSKDQIILLILKGFMLDGIYTNAQLNIMPQGWYCSSLLLGSTLIFSLCIKFEDNFAKIFAPILAVGIYIIFYLKFGQLNLYSQYGFIVTVGTFRAIAGLCLGVFLGTLYPKQTHHKKFKYSNQGFFLILTCLTFYTLLWNNGYKNSDFLMLIVFVAILYYLIQENEIFSFLNKPSFTKLGMVSYTIFLTHHLIATLFDSYNCFRSYDWKITSLIYLLTVILFSYTFYYIYNLGKQFIHLILRKVKL